MKKIFYVFMINAAFGLTFFSCGDDDSDTGISENEQLANEQNSTEGEAIPISSLTSGIEISGASKESGTPPSPNSELDFQISTEQQEGFQNTGFEIKFSSNASIAGAYIQFEDIDGNVDGYFDVPSSSIDNGRIGIKEREKRFVSSKGRTHEDELAIEIGFNSSIPAGTFCYTICLYDDENNVSQIQKVCVVVEAWGGNADIVGEWLFDRNEPGDEDDDQETITCNNEETITVDYQINEEEEWTFVLNSDGTYYELYDETYQYLDYSATQESCTAVYGETEQDQDKYSGRWAYNEEEGTLTVIDFKYEDLLNPTNSEDYTEGELYFEGVKAEVISGELVLSDDEDGETFKAIFTRK